MRCLCAVLLLSLLGLSLQRSTPSDDHYIAAVVEYTVSRDVAANKANYVALVQEAAAKNADIVVFPELTLTNRTTSFAVPLFGLLKQYPIPALRPDLYDELLVAMSAAARDSSVYLVINTRESVDCTIPQEGEDCPEQKQYVFNTNVVFDRTGAVIDRYRKINLFGEATHTAALKPDLGVFSTDFGVTFGHFICFDLMFQVPAIQVVQKNNVKDVIFTTMWFSEMPYLTAAQIQESYAYTLDVNFLAAGANNVAVGSTGSGIYSGKAGALVSMMAGKPTTKVLVAKVPKVPGKVTEIYLGPIYDDPRDHDSLKLIQDPSLASHVTRPLVQGLQEFTITDKDVSCAFRVKLSQRSNTGVKYRAFVHDGTHTYAHRREVGVTSCVVVACKTDEPGSCPYRFNQTEENIIEELEIKMHTYRKQYNSILKCDDVEYFPLSFRYNKFPLRPINFTYTTTINDNYDFPKCDMKHKRASALQNEIFKEKPKLTLNYKLSKPQNDLVVFGIWGRIYFKDIDYHQAVTQEDIQNFQTLLDLIYSTK